MLNQKQLANFAELCIKIGVNLQKGQRLVINCPVECADIAHTLSNAAYMAGAKDVSVTWIDRILERQALEYKPLEECGNIPQYDIDKRNAIVDDRACVISVSADDPKYLDGIDPAKIKKFMIGRRLAYKKYQDASMSNYVRWLVISVPTQKWAEAIFPNDPRPVDKLWDAIALTMRLNEENPLKAWENHIATLTRRSEYMNKCDFDHVHMTSKNGTDLKVGLADGHIWCAAQEMAQDGIPFTANMPTEEIFTAPHKYHVNGIVKNALPLVNNGSTIDDFSVTFKDGRIVDFSAKVGYDALKNIIETDDGSHYIGEVALIGKNSPIHNTGLMFFNTLFDENASCHLAFGKAYPTTAKGGNDMTVEQLDKIGLNNSLEHCDFMIGTGDMNIVGVKKNGEKVQLFVDGEWVI